ncbi:MAG: MBL fold metallo-hydrolase [Corallococcus sp.]|nr:MBL fold metallo-hydrolase [Corallococcus sp.]
MKEIYNGVYNVGVIDNSIDLFEGMYNVPDGVTYNSYVIVDDKLAVMDTVDARFGDEWLGNIDKILGGRTPDYLVVLHMEPDHSANIARFVEKYPDVSVVGNTKTFTIIGEYFGKDFDFARTEVKEGDVIDLGSHSLKFVCAPMVHWPEVMVAYDVPNKTLYSADAFGKFGSAQSADNWESEAARYYFGIVGKYGMQVQALLKKLAGLSVERIMPLHGPILQDKIEYYVEKYNGWSLYQPQRRGVLVAYTSVYGHTTKAAEEIAQSLANRGVTDVKLVDLQRDDWAECVAQAFAYSAIVLASTTYNADAFPAMREFLDRLKERNYQNRLVALVENGSWAPVSAKAMEKRLEGCKGITFCQNQVKIRSALNDESRAQISALTAELSAALSGK